MLENYIAKEITIGGRLMSKIDSVDFTLSELAEQLGSVEVLKQLKYLVT